MIPCPKCGKFQSIYETVSILRCSRCQFSFPCVTSQTPQTKTPHGSGFFDKEYDKKYDNIQEKSDVDDNKDEYSLLSTLKKNKKFEDELLQKYLVDTDTLDTLEVEDRKKKQKKNLLFNIYYLLDIIVPDFIEKEYDHYINGLEFKKYYKEDIFFWSVDKLNTEYNIFLQDKTSRNIFFSNLLNYSIFLCKNKSSNEEKYNQCLLNSGNENQDEFYECYIKAFTYKYEDIKFFYMKYLNLVYCLQDYRSDAASRSIIMHCEGKMNYPHFDKVYLYWSFNTANEAKMAKLEITRFAVSPVNMYSEIKVHGNDAILFCVDHDHVSHQVHERKKEKNSKVREKLIKILKVVEKSFRCEHYMKVIWWYSNETDAWDPFSLEKIKKVKFQINKSVIERRNVREKVVPFLVFLENNKIISDLKINEFELDFEIDTDYSIVE